MKIGRIVVSDYLTNCYLVFDENLGEVIIIDPGAEADKIIAEIKSNKLSPQIIVLTHAHLDHICGIQGILKEFYVPIAVHEDDVVFLENPNLNLSGGFESLTSLSPDLVLKEGDLIEVEGIELEVIHTPGHTPGSIALLGDGMIFSGDTIFKQGIGRTDLPGGSSELLLDSINRILEFPDEYVIYPGHGPETTVGNEKLSLDTYLGSI